jgi:hypothetical protein
LCLRAEGTFICRRYKWLAGQKMQRMCSAGGCFTAPLR